MSFIPSPEQKREDKLNPKKDDTQAIMKPITQSEDFCAELMDGTMDFTKVQTDEEGVDRQFLVAVNTGPRDKPTLLASTMRGPFDFYEMVESVGCMWENEQHHAMVYVLTTDFDKSSSFLDEGTIDYLEARWEDIVSTGIFEAALADDYSDGPIIPAGLIEADPEDD